MYLHRFSSENAQLLDGRRWVNILREFEKFDPSVIVPGHGERGPINIARDLASHIETVGREVRMLRLQGKSAEDIIREYKPEIVAAFPGWERPGLIDWEINYFASQVR